MSATDDALNAYWARDPEALRRIVTQLENRMEQSQKSLVEAIARVVHMVNRDYCMSHGDYSQPVWEAADEAIRESARIGVGMHLANPSATPEDSHKSWMETKTKQGWVYGPVKDPVKKEHPCMVPYAELDERQRAKDYIFRGIVHAIAHEQCRA